MKTELDFIILCEKRTGSHLLATLLNSHPSINCQFRELAMQNRKVIVPTKGEVRGGIIHYQEAEEALKVIDPKKVLHLVRDMKSVLRSYLATFYTQESRGHYTREEENPKEPKLDVDTEERKKIQNELWKRRNTSFGLIRRPTLIVSYGKLTAGHDVLETNNVTTRAILDFLEVEVMSLSTRLRKGVSSSCSKN